MSNELKVDVRYVIFVPNGVFLCWETSNEKASERSQERGREEACSEERKTSTSQVMMRIAIHFVVF